MTVSELYNQVARLLFESSLEDDAAFLYAAKRSLLQVCEIRPAIRSYTINHTPLKNVARCASFKPIMRSEELVIEGADAKAFYFEADGNGQCFAEVYINGRWQMANDTIMLVSNRNFKAYRGFFKYENEFVNGNMRLRFIGDYVYSVRNVALYSDVFSDRVEDIPAYEPFTRYDISRLTGDFLALATPPIAEDENFAPLMKGYDVEDGRVVLLPYDAGGCYTVRYKHKPTAIADDDPATSTQVIDLAEDLAALLPNLIASYMLTEDDMDRARHHYTLYQQQAAVIAAEVRNIAPGKITNNGW